MVYYTTHFAAVQDLPTCGSVLPRILSQSGELARFVGAQSAPAGGQCPPLLIIPLECWQTQKAGCGLLGLLSYCAYLPHDFEGVVFSGLNLMALVPSARFFTENTSKPLHLINCPVYMRTRKPRVFLTFSRFGKVIQVAFGHFLYFCAQFPFRMAINRRKEVKRDKSKRGKDKKEKAGVGVQYIFDSRGRKKGRRMGPHRLKLSYHT